MTDSSLQVTHGSEATIEPIHRNCVQEAFIRRHAAEIDAAHTKIRELQADIASLQALNQQYLERLVRVEDQTGRHSNLLEVIKGELDAIRVLQASSATQMNVLEELVRDTNRLIQTHVTASKIADSQEHVERLSEIERMTIRMVKITGLLSALVLVVSAVWKVVFGPGIGALLSGLFQ